MNPTTEQNINEAIDWLQRTGGSIQDFATQQAPLYCQEVVAWELWSGIAGAVLSLIALIPGILLTRHALRDLEGEDGYMIVPGIFLILCGVAVLTCEGSDALKAVTAPRLVIVEHLRGLTNH